MNVFLFFVFILLMPVITFLITSKKDNKPLKATELDTLYSYKYLLLRILQVEGELQTVLASTDYSLKNETCFRPLDIVILKKDIDNNLDRLTNMVLQQSISVSDFYSQIDHLHKRINILSFPLAA
jgi:hypothetical protein